MGSNYTGLTITHADNSDGYVTTTDVTSDLLAIPIFTDTGSGEVNEAILEFSAKGGKHINTGTLFEEYDRFRIQITDLDSNSYDRWFEMTDLIPTQNKSEGTIVRVKCAGIEYHTQVIHHAKRDWYQTADNVVNRVVGVYNANVGSRQPLITNHNTVYNTSTQIGNDMPKYTLNHYEFGANEDSCYNRLMDMVDLLGGTVPTGGINDYFDLTFETNAVNGIDIALFTSGRRSIDGQDPTNDASLVTIENTISINVGEQEGGISNPTGTRVCAWGSTNHGSLPKTFSQYRGEELEFTFRPEWTTGLLYKVGAKIVDGTSGSATVGRHYICATKHTAGTFATDLAAGKWTPIDFGTEFGDSTQYSQWTDDKAALWANSGSDSDATSAVSAWADSTAYGKFDIVKNGGAAFTAWVTSTAYVINDEVKESTRAYRCIVAHTSGTFATDLSAGKWQEIYWRTTVTHTSATTVNEPGGEKWIDSTAYTAVDEVYHDFRIWTCNTNHTSTLATDEPGRGTAWEDKWNKGGNWELCDNPVIGNGAGFFDSNLVVKDDQKFRTWVDEKGDLGIGLKATYRYDDATQWPIGWRFLNIDLETGTDRNGVDLTKSVVENKEFRVSGGISQGNERVVKYKPTANQNLMEVAVIDTGEIWEWVQSTSSWDDNHTTILANDCFHQYKNICNVDGVDPRPLEIRDPLFPEVTVDGRPFAKNIRSAVEVTYEYSAINNVPIFDAGYKKGAWLNFRFPFPVNTDNGISEGVGDIYGGGTNEATPTVPGTLDMENMSFTPTGLLGFNEVDSEELGPINAIAGAIRVSLEGSGGNLLDGMARIRCFMYDVNDNVGYYDFEVNFTNDQLGYKQGTWQSFVLPVAAFRPYRGRQTKSNALRLESASINFELPIKELDINEQLEMRHIKAIGFQLQDFYDEEGRYAPENQLTAVSNVGVGTTAGGFCRMAIDAFHFRKTLLAITGTDSLRNIEPAFLQRPNIISYKQLLNDANAQLQIEKFKLKAFSIASTGRSVFDIPFGDTFFLKNTELVVDADDGQSALGVADGTANTIRLVNKRTEYHFTKPSAGAGGLTRTINGVKRFV